MDPREIAKKILMSVDIYDIEDMIPDPVDDAELISIKDSIREIAHNL